MHFLKNFKDNEAGAVTVDWVVLIAAIIGLGLVVMSTLSGPVAEQPSTTETSN